jgi:hypothetical protein
VTVEKTAMDVIRQRENSKRENQGNKSTGNTTEVKGNLFDEMKKVQLKKFNK